MPDRPSCYTVRMTKPSMPKPLPDDVRAIWRFRKQHTKKLGAKPVEVIDIFEAFLRRLWDGRTFQDASIGKEPNVSTVFNHLSDWVWDGCLQTAWKKYVGRLSNDEKHEWTARLDVILNKKDGRASLFWFHDLYKALTGKPPVRKELRSST